MKRLATVHYLSERRAKRSPAVHEARLQALHAIILADGKTWLEEQRGDVSCTKKSG